MDRRQFLTGAVAMSLADIRALAEQIIQKVDELAGSAITWPKPNLVIQKTGTAASFNVTWQGEAASVEIRNGATVVATNSIGQFTDVPQGWYTLNLLDASGAVLNSIKFGVGDSTVTDGASNAANRVDTGYSPVRANAPGKCIIGIVTPDTKEGIASGAPTSIEYVDAYEQDVIPGQCYIHMANALNLPFPLMFTIPAVGSMYLQDLLSAAYLQRMQHVIDETNPSRGVMCHGEAHNVIEDENLPLFTQLMHQWVQSRNAMKPDIIWAVDLNCNPSTHDWAIVHAQKAVIKGFGGPYNNVHAGNDLTVAGGNDLIGNRLVGEIHYQGARAQAFGDMRRQRLPNVYGGWTF